MVLVLDENYIILVKFYALGEVGDHFAKGFSTTL